MSTAPYDPYEPNKIQQVQNEINSTVGIMRDNIDKVQKRNDDLENLQMKADNLNQASDKFNSAARDTRRHFWMQNLKMKFCLIAVVVILIIVIVVPIAVHFK